MFCMTQERRIDILNATINYIISLIVLPGHCLLYFASRRKIKYLVNIRDNASMHGFVLLDFRKTEKKIY